VRVGFDMTPARVETPGVGRYTADLSAALAQLPGVQLERLGFPALGDGALGRQAGRVGRSVAYYPVLLGRQAARRRVDVLHVPGPVAPVRAALPLVVTVHDVRAWREPEQFGRVAVRRHRLLVTRVVRSAARVLVGTEHMRRDVVELTGVPPGRVQVVPLGVDARFNRVEPDPGRLAHRFGIPPGPFILWVGTTEPRKGLANLLRAFALVRRRAPEVALVLVGEWGFADAGVERDLEQLGQSIIRPGFVTDDELVTLYSASACFCFPSLYEGFGLPPLEAMACGAPVVASDRGGIPEVIGDAGVLVDPVDADALADALESVVLSPERAADLRRRGAARARGFTWARSAELTLDAYRGAIAEAA